MVTTAAKIFDKTVPFYTDSLSVVQHASIPHWHATKHIFENDLDVILENHRYLKILKINMIPTHVLGHQDRVKSWDDLTNMEKLNVCLDKMAEDFLKAPPQHLLPRPHPLLFPAQQICIKKNGNVIATNIHNELVFGEKETIIRHYFTKHFNIPESTIGSIDWRCFAYVMKKIKRNDNF